MVELGLVGFYIYRTRERGGLEIGFVCLIGWMLRRRERMGQRIGIGSEDRSPVEIGMRVTLV